MGTTELGCHIEPHRHAVVPAKGAAFEQEKVAQQLENGVVKVVSEKLRSLAAGKMGYSTTESGGLSACYGTTSNCILWLNDDWAGGRICDTLQITYSCIQDWTGGGEYQ